MASGECKCCTVFAKIVLTLLNIFYLVNHSLLVPKFEVLFIFLCVGLLFIPSAGWFVSQWCCYLRFHQPRAL